VTCLQNKKIRGAALDVFDIEPLPKDSNLRAIDNLILTPHIGYVSFESYSKFFKGYFLAIEAFIDGNFVNVID
jgi:phosphoglycerate dehydrogenase-like enzyme